MAAENVLKDNLLVRSSFFLWLNPACAYPQAGFFFRTP
jgi:hypothetical protein